MIRTGFYCFDTSLAAPKGVFYRYVEISRGAARESYAELFRSFAERAVNDEYVQMYDLGMILPREFDTMAVCEALAACKKVGLPLFVTKPDGSGIDPLWLPANPSNP